MKTLISAIAIFFITLTTAFAQKENHYEGNAGSNVKPKVQQVLENSLKSGPFSIRVFTAGITSVVPSYAYEVGEGHRFEDGCLILSGVQGDGTPKVLYIKLADVKTFELNYKKEGNGQVRSITLMM